MMKGKKLAFGAPHLSFNLTREKKRNCCPFLNFIKGTCLFTKGIREK